MMNQKDQHIVSGIYASLAEAETARSQLVERGLPRAQTNVVQAASKGGDKIKKDDEVLKDIVVDGTIGAAVGAGLGAAAQVALVAANVSLFVASPVLAPLAMLGWGAALGGIAGATVGSEKSAATKDGKFSDLVMDAIQSGHVVLVARTRTAEEAALARHVIGDSVTEKV